MVGGTSGSVTCAEPPSAMPEVAYTQTAFSSATIDGVDYTYNFTTALPTNVT